MAAALVYTPVVPWRLVLSSALFFVACGSDAQLFFASPAGGDEVALVVWIDSAGQSIGGLSVMRPGSPLKLRTPADSGAQLFAFVYPGTLAPGTSGTLEECVVIGGTGARLPAPTGVFVASDAREAFVPAGQVPTLDLRFALDCEAPDCPPPSMTLFDFGDVEIDGMAVHEVDRVTVAGGAPGTRGHSRLFEVSQGLVTDQGLAPVAAQLAEMQALPGGGFVARAQTFDAANPSRVISFDVDRRIVRTSTFSGITRVSVGRDGFGLAGTLDGVWAFDGDSEHFLPELGTQKIPGVAVFDRDHFAIRSRLQLYLPDPLGKPAFDYTFNIVEGISKLSIDADTIGWVGQYELVRLRSGGFTQEIPRPLDQGIDLDVMEWLSDGDFVVAGESSLIARWRRDHWCPVPMEGIRTSFRIGGTVDQVVWLVGQVNDVSTDNVLVRLDYSDG